MRRNHVLAIRALVMLSALALSTLSFGQDINIDFDHSANFAKYQTYRWVTIARNPSINQLAEQRIVAAIDEQLAKKGLRKVDTGGDLVVGYQAAVKQQTQLTTFTDGGIGWGWGRSGIATTTASTIPVGALDIDLMDPQAKQLVFRGMARGTLSDKPEKNAKKIQKAVQKIFDKYPPKVKF